MTFLPLLALLARLSPTAAALSPAAADAFATGDCARAVVETPAASTHAEALALARCHLVLGNTAMAQTLLAPLEGGALGGYAALLLAEAALAANRHDEVVRRTAGVVPAGEAGARTQLMRAIALIETGDPEGGRDLLRGLLSGARAEAGYLPSANGVDAGEVRWWLAEQAVRRDRTDAAIPVWQTIWVRNPHSPFADRAQAALAAAGSPVPDPDSDRGRELIAARIATLDGQRSYKESLALRQTLPDAAQGSAGTRARACFRGKDYACAVKWFAAVSSPSMQQRFDHALAMSRTGDYAAAADLYRAVIAAGPSHKLADFASYKLGYLDYDAGRLELAIDGFAAYLAAYPSGQHADEARWFTGWASYRLGNLDAAAAAFDALLTRHGSSGLAPGAAYWRARIHGARGDADAERAGLEDVLRRWPTSGHAWFAAERTGKQYPAVPVAAPPAAPAALATDAWHRGQALAAVGLLDWAREELQPLVPAAKAAGKDGALAMAHALVAAGDYVGAKALAAPYCTSPWKGGDPVAQQACTPRPQGEMVARLTATEQLPTNLPFAIMTAESALKPWVTSLAGARGLMQMMPDLAESHHVRRFPARPYDANDLYRPAYNAALGVTELGSLRATFAQAPVSPDLVLVIAGYNGGAEAVQRWLDAAGPGVDGDAFAENIGYTETRRYVRKVLGYLQTYRYVYGDG